ncbi:class I adenylate-forming enzyme family protein [Streptacidiphilus sp. N1-10]|uniref:Class I adenylate-forming enzyme family protein n=1 Tax=Streptacidiphilus jeojiensis TaxID=3229225 RepID=A0ABV6XG51_9ACTN
MTNLEHPPPGPDLPALSARLRRVLTVDPDATALTFEDTDHPWSYFEAAARDLDAMLAAHPGARRVGVVLRNRPGPLAALLGTLATGRQVVTLSPHSGDTGLADEVTALRPDVVVAAPQDWGRPALRSAAEQVRAVPVVCRDDAPLLLLPDAWRPAPATLPAEDTAVLMTTSGTTGRPKRVALSYPQVTSSLTAAGTVLADEPRLRTGRVILWSSLAHISGLYFALAHAVEGRAVVLMERFEVEPWAELVRRHRPRQLRLPPTAIRMVLSTGIPPEVFEGVRAIGSGTAPLPPELSEEFEARYGVPLLTTYGATEFAGAIAGWSLADHRDWARSKRGSVGRAHRGIELRIVDPDSGAVLPCDTVGLLEARGAQLPSGPDWLRTTDLASLDADRFLFIHGRADDAINRGGFKIPPSVIEDALRTHPAVSDAAAVGLPEERLGEVPAVAVTVSGPATEQELLDHLTRRLTRYQMPVALRIVEQLPRTASLKVSRPEVRDLFATAPGLESARSTP